MIQIRPLGAGDYAAASALWRASEGVVLRSGDTYEGFLRFLERNPGLSLGAFANRELVGAVMVGHDGRRGYLYHMAVTPMRQRSGIGRQLVEEVLRNMRNVGIDGLHVFVETDNQDAKRFWAGLGWRKRLELVIFSRSISG